MLNFWLDDYLEELDSLIDRYSWLYGLIDGKIEPEVKKGIGHVAILLNNHKLILKSSRYNSYPIGLREISKPPNRINIEVIG